MPLFYPYPDHLDKERFLDTVEEDFQDGSLDSMTYRDFFLRSEAIEAQDKRLYNEPVAKARQKMAAELLKECGAMSIGR